VEKRGRGDGAGGGKEGIAGQLGGARRGTGGITRDVQVTGVRK